MRKTLAVFAVAAVWGLAAMSQAQAAVTDNERIPLNLPVYIPCANSGAGEVVDLSGDLHVLLTFTINGRQVSGVALFQPMGVSGVGETTGTLYRGTGMTRDQFKLSFQNGQAVQTLVNNFRIIGSGPGNNLLIHETFHITVNANGEVTAIHDVLSADCK